MFILKQVENLEQKFDELEKRFRHLDCKQITPDYVECEVCGCLLNKNTATKGSGEIRQKYNRGFDKEDFIYYPYFCKTHIPIPRDKK